MQIGTIGPALALTVALAGAGSVLGALLVRWLRPRHYRLEDEVGPTGGPLWWLVPGLALAWGLLGHHLRSQPALVLASALLFAALGAALIAIDLDVHRLPDFLVLPAYPVLALLLAANAAITGEWGALGRAALAALAPIPFN